MLITAKSLIFRFQKINGDAEIAELDIARPDNVGIVMSYVSLSVRPSVTLDIVAVGVGAGLKVEPLCS